MGKVGSLTLSIGIDCSSSIECDTASAEEPIGSSVLLNISLTIHPRKKREGSAHVGHVNGIGRPIRNIRDVADSSAQPYFDVGQVGTKDRVDGIVPRQLYQGVGATKVEGVEKVGSVVLSTSHGLS